MTDNIMGQESCMNCVFKLHHMKAWNADVYGSSLLFIMYILQL